MRTLFSLVLAMLVCNAAHAQTVFCQVKWDPPRSPITHYELMPANFYLDVGILGPGYSDSRTVYTSTDYDEEWFLFPAGLGFNPAHWQMITLGYGFWAKDPSNGKWWWVHSQLNAVDGSGGMFATTTLTWSYAD